MEIWVSIGICRKIPELEFIFCKTLLHIQMFLKLSPKLQYNPQQEVWYLKGYNVITAGEKTCFNSNHQKCSLLHPRLMSYIALKKYYFRAVHL